MAKGFTEAGGKTDGDWDGDGDGEDRRDGDGVMGRPSLKTQG